MLYHRPLHREHWQHDPTSPRNLPLRCARLRLYTYHSLIVSVPGEFEDVALSQWLAFVPPALVKAHLGVDDATIAKFSRVNQEVVGPANPSA